MSNLPPIEVPQGAIRLNTDSQKLEFFAQDRWYEFATHSDVFDGGAGIALIFEGDASSNSIDVINVTTGGNATDYGQDHHNNSSVGGSGDRTRAICYGGGPSGTQTNKIEFYNISTKGNSGIDFGDLTFTGRQPGNAHNSTRSLMCGGYPSPFSTADAVNTICFVVTQSTGNATDFGDLVTTGEQTMASSPTRAVGIGGYGVSGGTPSPGTRFAECQFITTHTLGNSQEFSELANARNDANGCGNNVRGVFMGGGQNSPLTPQTDQITFVEFASLGRPTDFGNLSAVAQSHSATSNKIRAVKNNGYYGDGQGTTNQLEYVNIATGGNAVDFGDATHTGGSNAAHCNAQGGL